LNAAKSIDVQSVNYCQENLKSNYENYKVSVVDMPFEDVGQGYKGNQE